MNEENRMKAVKWLIYGETGISSICLCAAFFDYIPEYKSIPADYSDFNRCVKFLELFDEETQELIWENASKISPKWDRLSYAWNDIYELYLKKEYHKIYEILHEIDNGVY